MSLSTSRRHRAAQRSLRIESLESRQLLAVDLLANLTLDDGARFTPRNITGYQGQVVFRGDDGFVGPEAWITSGDPADVRLLKDIRVGPGGSGPRDFAEFNGRLFFAANNGTNGYELWVTQGSKASTQLIGDIWEGGESGVPTEITVFNGSMYFFANDGVSGRELYRSDGTPTGIELVADAVPERGGSSGEDLTIAGDKMFFISGSTIVGESGLWVSNGTAEGTLPLVIPDVQEDDVRLLTPYGNRLLFANNGRLFVTDGTVAGSSQIDVAGAGGAIEDIAVLGDRIFLTKAGSSELRIIEGDLTTSKTVPNAEGVKVSNGRTYHWSSNGFYVLEPDDTSTRLIPFNSFFGTRMGSTFDVENGMLFNINRTLDRYEIWATNGTPEGTKMVEMVTDTSEDPLLDFQQIGDSIYFAATNENFRQSVWKVPAPTIEPAELPDPPSVEGDVTGDTLVNVQDVDAVFAAAIAGSVDTAFDTNGDGQIGSDDGTYIVESVLNTRVGDLDLNGKVEFADFLILSANFSTDVASYADGDADGDGKVAFSDFLLMSDNFGFDRDVL